ncbi:hypothetical protein D3C74_361490 [compost metagenome]
MIVQGLRHTGILEILNGAYIHIGRDGKPGLGPFKVGPQVLYILSVLLQIRSMCARQPGGYHAIGTAVGNPGPHRAGIHLQHFYSSTQLRFKHLFDYISAGNFRIPGHIGQLHRLVSLGRAG